MPDSPSRDSLPISEHVLGIVTSKLEVRTFKNISFLVGKLQFPRNSGSFHLPSVRCLGEAFLSPFRFSKTLLEDVWDARVLQCVESLFGDALNTPFQKIQYLQCQMLHVAYFCNISHALWAILKSILTCQALLRGAFPRQNSAIRLEVLQTLEKRRFLFKTPSDFIRRSLGLPSGGLLAS